MVELALKHDARRPLRILCLGAHSDDIEIGCGGTILHLSRAYAAAACHWAVFSAPGEQRRREALAGAGAFLEDAAEKQVRIEDFRESFLPYAGERLKECFEEIKSSFEPDLIFTHHRGDLHQDHKVVAELTWQTFRRSLVLEYEIPKWDGGLGTPNCYVPLAEELAERKIERICATFTSQSAKSWFTPDTFRSLMRLRGIEANVPLAEAFYAHKLTLA